VILNNSESVTLRKDRKFTVPSHRVPKNKRASYWENSLLPKPVEKKKPIFIDFLKERREKRSNQSTEGII